MDVPLDLLEFLHRNLLGEKMQLILTSSTLMGIAANSVRFLDPDFGVDLLPSFSVHRVNHVFSGIDDSAGEAQVAVVPHHHLNTINRLNFVFDIELIRTMTKGVFPPSLLA